MFPGDALKELRKSMGGISQEQLARMLNVTTRSVARYEAGQSPRGTALMDLIMMAEAVGRPDIVTGLRGHPSTATATGSRSTFDIDPSRRATVNQELDRCLLHSEKVAIIALVKNYSKDWLLTLLEQEMAKLIARAEALSEKDKAAFLKYPLTKSNVGDSPEEKMTSQILTLEDILQNLREDRARINEMAGVVDRQQILFDIKPGKEL